MKVLIAPDSFKGSLSAPEAAHCIRDGFLRVFPDADVVTLPVADGGEGTLDALVTATGGMRFTETVTGPLGDPVEAVWGLCGDGKTAVIELAQAAGLHQVPPGKRDPKTTTTYGVGELLLASSKHPERLYPRTTIIGLGGSATNDGGVGLLSALGVRFLDKDERPLPPGGAALSHLASVDVSGLTIDEETAMLIACDVTNPLCGPQGASHIFGPQKGATQEDVDVLDAALEHYGQVVRSSGTLRRSAERSGWPQLPGAGAAGGTAAGLLWVFPNAVLRSGIDLVMDTIGFDRHLAGADLVLTGEGRLDGQTLGGKAIAGVARRAKAAGVPVAALVGSIGDGVDAGTLAEVGLDAACPIVPGAITLDEAMADAQANLTNAAERAARWLRLGERCDASNRTDGRNRVREKHGEQNAA